MKCSRCQQENPAGMNFCGGCGARLAALCSSCGASNPPANKFCGQCGTQLPQDPSSLKFASPENYTPKHLAEKILTSKGALEGERKQVTVLFADLKGSMELLADRDPEEARKLLDPVLEHMMEAVHRYEGTVNQVMGDGIMALFGAPLAHEDHAVRACYAALRMQEAIRRYNEEVRRSHGIEVQIRVGLNSGEVVVRSIGNDLHMDYTAVGQTTHLAARMEQLAIPGSIRLTAEALRLAEGYVQVKPLGPIPVKGLPDPVEVYEIVGGGSVRTRLQAAAMRGFSRFVGRDAELEQLRRSLQQAQEGRGQVVAAVGEPGVGKSRLFYEFTHSHRTQDWLILESGSASYGKATAYLPIIDLLKEYFRIQDRDDHREIREKVTGKLLTLDRALEVTLPAFLSLLDVPVEDPQWQDFAPPQRRRRTLDGVKRLVLKESQVQPLCLVFEDLHWIDSETQAFLDNLIESLPTTRLLLLVNYRPEYQHSWGSKTFYTQLRLDPLTPESAEELLEALLGTDAGLKRLKRLLIERTQGNPFFLEESVRTLIETNALIGERGAYRLTKDLPSIQVPATVQAVLAARIDRLPPEDKRLLQTASVIGEDVPFTLLHPLVEMSEEELHRGLSRLQADEFLYETSLFPDLEYTFKHGLTYQVAYNSLLVERRCGLHARIVGTIETLYHDRLADQVERLAHHTFRGEVWEKAVSYLRQAGKKAGARSANQEAVAYFEQALAALAHLPDSAKKTELAVDVRLEMRPSLVPLGAKERLIEHLTQAESLAEALGDKWRLGRVHADMTAHYAQFGEDYRAVNPGERALAIATELGDFALQVSALDRLARAYVGLGDYHRAIDLSNRSMSLLEGKPVGERFGLTGVAAVVTRIPLIWSFAELGEFTEGLARGQEAVRIAEMVGQPFSLVAAYWSLSRLYLIKGDIEKALPLLERSLHVCQDAQVPIWSSPAKSGLGYAYLQSGRVPEALPLLEQDIERPTMGRFHTLQISWLGEAYLLAGRREEAIKVTWRGFNRARDKKEKGLEAWVLRLLGVIATHKDPPDVNQAKEHYHQAISLADELGMRPLIARCHAGIAELYRQIGKRQQAKEHLTIATARMREMGMGLWLEKAEAELKELR